MQATLPGVQREGSKARATTASAPVLQRTPADDAAAKNDAKAVEALTPADIAKASPDLRARLIGIELDGGNGEALPRLWNRSAEGSTPLQLRIRMNG